MGIRRHAYARALQKRAMPDSFTVSRPGAPSASRGQFTQTSSSVATGVAGRWESATGSESIPSGVIVGVKDVIVELEAFTDVRAEDTLTVVARGSEGAHTFTVKAPLARSDEWSVKVLATEG